MDRLKINKERIELFLNLGAKKVSAEQLSDREFSEQIVLADFFQNSDVLNYILASIINNVTIEDCLFFLQQKGKLWRIVDSTLSDMVLNRFIKNIRERINTNQNKFFKKYRDGITTLFVLPDKKVVSLAHDNSLKIWKPYAVQVAKVLKITDHKLKNIPVTELLLHSDNTFLCVFENGKAQKWNAQTWDKKGMIMNKFDTNAYIIANFSKFKDSSIKAWNVAVFKTLSFRQFILVLSLLQHYKKNKQYFVFDKRSAVYHKILKTLPNKVKKAIGIFGWVRPGLSSCFGLINCPIL